MQLDGFYGQTNLKKPLYPSILFIMFSKNKKFLSKRQRLRHLET